MRNHYVPEYSGYFYMMVNMPFEINIGIEFQKCNQQIRMSMKVTLQVLWSVIYVEIWNDPLINPDPKWIYL